MNQIDTALHAAFAIGFVTTWLGFACFLISVAAQVVFTRGYWNALRQPFVKRHDHFGYLLSTFLTKDPPSRLNRAAQVLFALGTSILILTGLVWLAVTVLR